MTETCWHTLIRNAVVFDGSGAKPQQIDLAISDGKIAAKGRNLPTALAARVIDGEGQWLMPGLLDIHTHLDLEVDLDPRLPEVVRHGTTTVLVGNCSLGTCFGRQQVGWHCSMTRPGWRSSGATGTTGGRATIPRPGGQNWVCPTTWSSATLTC